jgi:hypothetical protein
MKLILKYAMMLLVAVMQADDDVAGAKRVTMRGTHLSVVPAPNFGESAGFTGLESKEHEASLMFVEIPTPGGGDPIQEFSKSLTPERLRGRGFILKSRETGKQNGQSTLLLKGEVRKDGQTYVQWVFLVGSSEARVGQVLATAPTGEFRRIEEAFKLMLASVRWEKQLAAATGRHGYTLILPPGWKLARQFGPVDLYTESGRFPKPQGESGLGVTNLNEKPTNFQAFVKANNLKRNHYANLKELESTFLRINGFDANISHVSALRVEDRKPVTLQYCYIFIGETTILIEGDRTSKLPKETFEQICKSWKVKKPADERKP